MMRPGFANSRLEWPELQNARDLGGLPLASGGLTAGGVLIRSDTLARLTPVGRVRLLEHGVRSIIDLREACLMAAEPNHPVATPPGVKYHHVPLLPADFPLPVIRGGYLRAVDAAQPVIAVACRALLASDGCTIVHCHSGTGRTGIVAILLLELAGAAEDAIEADYLASYPGGDPGEEAAVPRQVLTHLRGTYGGASRYLSMAGLTIEEVVRLRTLLRGDKPRTA